MGARFVDSLLQPIAKKQESYIKDTTHFINLTENTPLPHKPILWKRFIGDMFSVWTLSEREINDFVDFASLFHATIKFLA